MPFGVLKQWKKKLYMLRETKPLNQLHCRLFIWGFIREDTAGYCQHGPVGAIYASDGTTCLVCARDMFH
jgi:hypothetical protein